MLKMLPEMIQFTSVSELEIVIIFQSKFQTQKSEGNQSDTMPWSVSPVALDDTGAAVHYQYHSRKAYRRGSQRKDNFFLQL